MPGSDVAKVIDQIKSKFPGIEVDEMFTVTAPAGDLFPLMQELKSNTEFDFNFMTNLTAVDYPENFVMVYNLVSFRYGYTLMVKTMLPKDSPEAPSLFPLWGAADWQEREVYDMFGIVFTGRPNLKRILLEEDFEGHPLRKDYKYEHYRQQE